MHGIHVYQKSMATNCLLLTYDCMHSSDFVKHRNQIAQSYGCAWRRRGGKGLHTVTCIPLVIGTAAQNAPPSIPWPIIIIIQSRALAIALPQHRKTLNSCLASCSDMSLGRMSSWSGLCKECQVKDRALLPDQWAEVPWEICLHRTVHPLRTC